MTKLRSLVVTGLLGLVVLCAAPAQAAQVPAASSVVYSVNAQLAGAASVSVAPRQQPPGPVLDPAETDKANKEKSRNKIIAGVVAALLLLIVILGRRQRKKSKSS
ncbi:hypothetical protein ACFWY9_34955 [Amycolatopsis sp. NPDC059027]|uniref:hypothetical protein n=1 Tax=unclassified Amycolatopsis TaxID=2618356 RepID=UPI00366F19AA